MKTLSKTEKLELLSKLSAEHQSLKQRLRVLESQASRTPAEQIEIAEIKKRKLLTKDRLHYLQSN